MSAFDEKQFLVATIQNHEIISSKSKQADVLVQWFPTHMTKIKYLQQKKPGGWIQHYEDQIRDVVPYMEDDEEKVQIIWQETWIPLQNVKNQQIKKHYIRKHKLKGYH